MKLNQLIAIVANKKNEAARALRVAREVFGQESMFEGHIRSYKPFSDADRGLPDETRTIQARWEKVLRGLFEIIGDSGDVVAGIDVGNTGATADVKVGGTALLTGVPATQLIFLEKQLGEVRKTILAAPTLDPAISWEFDENQGWYVSEGVKTHRTQKIPTRFVKAEATDRHPAQVEILSVDAPVGEWTSTRMSAAMPLRVKEEMVARVDELIVAVVQARETANMADAKPVAGLSALLEYILPGHSRGDHRSRS